MNSGELNLVAQLIESMDLATQQLDESFKANDAEKFKQLKSEMLKFQKEISELLRTIS